MIPLGAAVIAHINTAHEFRGHVVAFIPGARGPQARLLGERMIGRVREAREFRLTELTVLDEPPLHMLVGSRRRVYGHDVRVLARDEAGRTSAMLSILDRKSGVRFERRYNGVPDFHIRTGR